VGSTLNILIEVLITIELLFRYAEEHSDIIIAIMLAVRGIRFGTYWYKCHDEDLRDLTGSSSLVFPNRLRQLLKRGSVHDL
jgi:hypothetical protein